MTPPSPLAVRPDRARDPFDMIIGMGVFSFIGKGVKLWKLDDGYPAGAE